MEKVGQHRNQTDKHTTIEDYRFQTFAQITLAHTTLTHTTLFFKN